VSLHDVGGMYARETYEWQVSIDENEVTDNDTSQPTTGHRQSRACRDASASPQSNTELYDTGVFLTWKWP